MASHALNLNVPASTVTPKVEPEMATGRQTTRRQSDSYEDYELAQAREDAREWRMLAHKQADALVVQKAGNGGGVMAKWGQWFPIMLTCGVLLATTVRSWSTTESELRQQLIQAQSDAKAAISQGATDRALIDKILTYQQNSRESFAAHGWIIDPDTGKITKARR